MISIRDKSPEELEAMFGKEDAKTAAFRKAHRELGFSVVMDGHIPHETYLRVLGSPEVQRVLVKY